MRQPAPINPVPCAALAIGRDVAVCADRRAHLRILFAATKEKFGGTGLGLAICRDIALAMVRTGPWSGRPARGVQLPRARRQAMRCW